MKGTYISLARSHDAQSNTGTGDCAWDFKSGWNHYGPLATQAGILTYEEQMDKNLEAAQKSAGVCLIRGKILTQSLSIWIFLLCPEEQLDDSQRARQSAPSLVSSMESAGKRAVLLWTGIWSYKECKIYPAR